MAELYWKKAAEAPVTEADPDPDPPTVVTACCGWADLHMHVYRRDPKPSIKSLGEGHAASAGLRPVASGGLPGLRISMLGWRGGGGGLSECLFFFRKVPMVL